MVFENSVENIKSFVVDNGIVGTTAGVCVGLAAKDAIQSFVNDIIVPVILIFINSFHADFIKRYLDTTGKKHLDITNFIKNFITFMLIVIISFLFVNIAFGYLLGISNKKDTKDK
jgi:large-conductance mechanosensitive channel